ncbi:MAG: DUF4395 domain-containing protein [Bacteroidetes bacterium]|nr:DUF4395 domain-containing protein [Bacteroidota bacterium]
MTTDEIKIRMTALWVLLLSIGYLLLGYSVIPALLVADFALRSFNLGRWSPLFRLSAGMAGLLNRTGRPVYLPAKRFAARIGLVVSVLMLAFALAGSPVALGLAFVLVVFAGLESLAGICAGCYLYDLIQRLAN